MKNNNENNHFLYVENQILCVKISFIIFIIFFINIILFSFRSLNHHPFDKKNTINSDKINKIIDDNFEYHNYERELITDKIKKYAGYEQKDNEPYFLNGIIRIFKPKKCLEIGVARGGSSIVILNALKDYNSSLVSLDLREQYYRNKNLTTGFAVKKYFPELANNKWKLFTGEQPHKFLSKLDMKYDFLFLDTVHLAPGELFNIIEALPFLEDNAIIVLHDIAFHFPSNNYYKPKTIKFHPSQIYLMTSLIGKKIILPNKEKGFENIGAIILYPNQSQYYLNYFLLLLTPWDYLPKESFIEELRVFIKKYYKNDLFLNLFNRSVEENRIYVLKHQKFLNFSQKFINTSFNI